MKGAKRQKPFMPATFFRLAQDRSGLGAIEFAILFPLLVMLYIGAFEITIGLSVGKRAARSAASIADIVTQQKSVTKTSLAQIGSVANAVFAPYGTDGMAMTVTAIDIDSSANAKVFWSWSSQSTSAPYAVNSSVSGIPADMKKADSFLVRADLSIPYRLFAFGPGFMPDGLRTMTIHRTYYYRQRLGTNVPCTDC
jgi:Flp pilus assembly protein TadG